MLRRVMPSGVMYAIPSLPGICLLVLKSFLPSNLWKTSAHQSDVPVEGSFWKNVGK